MTTNWKAEAIDALQTVAWGNWAERCDFLSNLPMRLVQEFAILCAEKALSAWERDYPQDGRPKAAIAAAKAFLGGAIGEEACGEAARGAANAANAAAYTANAAYCAARAASAAAYATAYATAYAALAADAAYAAGHASIGGWDWQVPLLTDLITNWED